MIKDYDKIYIQDCIINHLERYTKYELEERQMPWSEMEESLNLCESKGLAYMSTLHQMMLPYYEMYMFADTKLFRTGNPYARHFVERVAGKDADFGSWVAGKDIVAATESWGDFLKLKGDRDAWSYLRMMNVLVHSSYTTDWKKMAEELKERLYEAEAISNYKTDELLCILHAVAMIMQTGWSKTKKIQFFDLMSEHWGFLKYVYSVMTRHIVGCRFNNFAQVTNAVMQSSDNKPHLHIYYCILTDRINDFQLAEKQYRKLDDLRLRLRNEMDRNEPSEILYELCDTIFPEEFQRILDEHRPPSYNEIKDDNKQKDELIGQMQKQTNLLHQQLHRIGETLRQMLESAIPIEDIDAELEKYPPGMAWDMLNQLNSNAAISIQAVWRDHYPQLVEKYRKRLYEPIMQQENLTNAMKKVAERPTYSYGAGSAHYDHRQQMMLGQETEKIVKLKCLTNE